MALKDALAHFKTKGHVWEVITTFVHAECGEDRVGSLRCTLQKLFCAFNLENN